MNPHWWYIVIGLWAMFLSGFLAGLGWKFERTYQRGRRDMADDIEYASGMHDPVCTCASSDTGIIYKCPYHRLQDEQEANRKRRAWN